MNDLMNLLEENKKLAAELDRVKEAAIELLDGFHEFDLEKATGINSDRCRELLSIIRSYE